MCAMSTSLVVSDELYEQLQQLAKKRGCTPEAILASALRQYLMTASLDEVYGEDYEPEPGEREFLREASRRTHERLLREETEPWQ